MRLLEVRAFAVTSARSRAPDVPQRPGGIAARDPSLLGFVDDRSFLSSKLRSQRLAATPPFFDDWRVAYCP
jgi:hypothetical protein